jgi:hypothetical protein
VLRPSKVRASGLFPKDIRALGTSNSGAINLAFWRSVSASGVPFSSQLTAMLASMTSVFTAPAALRAGEQELFA